MYKARVVVGESDRSFKDQLKDVLRRAGYVVIGEAGSGRLLLQVVLQTSPDLVIMEHQLPGSEGMGLAGIIEEHRVAPVVLTADLQQANVAELVRSPGVYGVLPRPLQEDMVVPVIELALALFERVVQLEKEVSALRRSLEERKLVEKAKGLLMEKLGMTEREAYRYLQKKSMDHCVPLVKVAREVMKAFKE